MSLRSKLPAILLIVGGLILSLSPLLDRLTFHSDTPSDPVDGAWVVVIEETSERSPAVARVAADGSFWRDLEKRGVNWRFYDVDAPNAKSYIEPAKRAGIPAVLILDQDGKILRAATLPATTDGIDALVKETVRK